MRRNSRDRRQNEGAGGTNGNAEEIENAGGENTQQQEENQQGVPAWQAVMFEQRQASQRQADENARLQRELEIARQNQNQNNNQQAPLANDVMLTDPNSFRNAINQDIAAQVAPLNAFAQEHQRQQAYHREKLNCMSDASTGINSQAWQQLFPYLDPYFLNNPTIQPTRQAIINQAKVLIADYFLTASLNQNTNNNQNNNQGNQGQNNNNQNQNQNQNNQNRPSNMNPPHLRPTGAPSRQPGNTNNQEVFTENDRRLMRESNLTPGEYVMLRDVIPSESEVVWKKITDARKANQRIQ